MNAFNSDMNDKRGLQSVSIALFCFLERFCRCTKYRIRGNFRGFYISRITCQEDFRIFIFADDLPLNNYTDLDYCLLIEIFED